MAGIFLGRQATFPAAKGVGLRVLVAFYGALGRGLLLAGPSLQEKLVGPLRSAAFVRSVHVLCAGLDATQIDGVRACDGRVARTSRLLKAVQARRFDHGTALLCCVHPLVHALGHPHLASWLLHGGRRGGALVDEPDHLGLELGDGLVVGRLEGGELAPLPRL